MRTSRILLSILFPVLLSLVLVPPGLGQEAPLEEEPLSEGAPELDGDRKIYVPFKNLKDVFEKEGQGVFVRAAAMNKVNVDVFNAGLELWPTVELFFKTAPIVSRRPIIGELTCIIQRDALRPVVGGFPLWPAGPGQSLLQVFQF